MHVNPKYIVLESDFTNNVVRCNIHYTGRYVSTTNCKIVQYVFAQPLTPIPTTFLPEEQDSLKYLRFLHFGAESLKVECRCVQP